MSYVVMTDTSANIPTELVKEKNITVIPLSYHKDDQECICLDSDSFNASEYYSMLKSGVKVTTSQINPQRYIDSMEEALREGKDILFVGMSSGISGSYNSAKIAQEQLLIEYPERKIGLVNSLGASLGEGMLVLEAVACEEQGMDLEDAVAYLKEKRMHIAQLFTVDDLMYLRRGGRLSNATALVGTVLNVKPVLKGNENGKIVTCGKVRGRKKVIEELARRYDELVVDAEHQTVYISQCNCPEDAQQLANLLRRNHPPRDFMIVEHEPVTGSYLGSGGLAFYFTGKDDIRTK